MPGSFQEIPMLKITHEVRNYDMGSQDTNSVCLAREKKGAGFLFCVFFRFVLFFATYVVRYPRTSRKFIKFSLQVF